MHLDGHGLLRALVFFYSKIILCKSGFNISVLNCFLIHNKPPIFTFFLTKQLVLIFRQLDGQPWKLREELSNAVLASICLLFHQAENITTFTHEPFKHFQVPHSLVGTILKCADRLQRWFPSGHSTLQVEFLAGIIINLLIRS